MTRSLIEVVAAGPRLTRHHILEAKKAVRDLARCHAIMFSDHASSLARHHLTIIPPRLVENAYQLTLHHMQEVVNVLR